MGEKWPVCPVCKGEIKLVTPSGPMSMFYCCRDAGCGWNDNNLPEVEPIQPVAEEKCGQMIGDRLVNVEPAPCVRSKGHDGFCVANWGDKPSGPSEGPKFKIDGKYLIKPWGPLLDLGWFGGDRKKDVVEEIEEAYSQGRLSMQGEVEQLKADEAHSIKVQNEMAEKMEVLSADLAKANERWEKLRKYCSGNSGEGWSYILEFMDKLEAL